jgi:hypothetical protein
MVKTVPVFNESAPLATVLVVNVNETIDVETSMTTRWDEILTLSFVPGLTEAQVVLNQVVFVLQFPAWRLSQYAAKRRVELRKLTAEKKMKNIDSERIFPKKKGRAGTAKK